MMNEVPLECPQPSLIFCCIFGNDLIMINGTKNEFLEICNLAKYKSHNAKLRICDRYILLLIDN